MYPSFVPYATSWVLTWARKLEPSGVSSESSVSSLKRSKPALDPAPPRTFSLLGWRSSILPIAQPKTLSSYLLITNTINSIKFLMFPLWQYIQDLAIFTTSAATTLTPLFSLVWITEVTKFLLPVSALAFLQSTVTKWDSFQLHSKSKAHCILPGLAPITFVTSLLLPSSLSHL